MAPNTKPSLREWEEYEVRNAVIGAYQNMPQGPERDAVEEIFERFTHYLELNTSMIPGSELGTPHEKKIASLKYAIDFFMTMGQVIDSLGLVRDWKLPPKDLAKGAYLSVMNERTKRSSAIELIGEIYAVHLGGNGALFSIDALPEEIRESVKKKLKSRGLLRD